MTAVVPATGYESFFALYWDHVRSLPRLAVLMLAKIPADKAPEFEARSWDELLEFERAAIRSAILDLVEYHEHTRHEAARRRELQGAA